MFLCNTAVGQCAKYRLDGHTCDICVMCHQGFTLVQSSHQTMDSRCRSNSRTQHLAACPKGGVPVHAVMSFVKAAQRRQPLECPLTFWLACTTCCRRIVRFGVEKGEGSATQDRTGAPLFSAGIPPSKYAGFLPRGPENSLGSHTTNIHTRSDHTRNLACWRSSDCILGRLCLPRARVKA